MSRKLTSAQANTAAILAEAEDLKTRAAYDLRRKGKSWWQIAEELELTEKGAQMRVEQAIAAASDMIGEHRKRQLLMLEVDRLDELMAAHYEAATTWKTSADADGSIKSTPPSIEAGRYVLDVIMKRAKLLGLEDMTTVNVTQQTVVVAGTNEEYVAALKLIVNPNTIVEGSVER